VTEQEWLNCRNFQRMFGALWDKDSERKLRLFAVACCRRTRNPLRSKRTRRLLELSEQFADGRASKEALSSVKEEWCDSLDKQAIQPWQMSLAVATIADLPPRNVAWGAAFHAALAAANPEREKEKQCDLLRDIFGNPFRPVTLDPVWLTPSVQSLAQTAYEDRAFDLLPVLADALEDAGCTDPDILDHCRGEGKHVRGCWVLDLLLGKE
jgi:hypothetical protein